MSAHRENNLFAKLMFGFAFMLVILDAEAQECGTVSPKGKEIPWQAALYSNSNTPSEKLVRRCGGTLISSRMIVTAAHCFGGVGITGEKINLGSPVVVAVGNLTQDWIEHLDKNTQKSDIKEFHLSPGYDIIGHGSVGYFLEDIAVAIVIKPFSFNDYIRPVCVDFDYNFEQTQLKVDIKGTVAAWSSMAEYPEKYVKDLYTVNVVTCVADKSNRSTYFSYTDHSTHYTLSISDKICAQAKDPKSALCYGDSGIGLAFPSTKKGVKRYYLRGVLSRPFNADKLCTIEAYYAFTSVLKHESFIRKYWNDSVAESPKQIGNCILPPYPDHGTYTTNVTNISDVPGDEDFAVVTLTVTCDQGYGVIGSNSIECYNGFWPKKNIPSCVMMCELKPHPSVEYRCLVSGNAIGSRDCSLHEPIGTIVSPRCREPDFYSTSDLTFMRCKDDGHWDYVAKCSPECGKVTPDGKELVVGGMRVKKGELPWHSGIYMKNTKPFTQICGGSLISNKLIISAAHCFWTVLEKQLSASLFGVAVGKIYRPWDDPIDEAQKSDVKEIHMPRRYQGINANFQDDIAVVIVVNAFEYKPHVRPVCLSFDYNFDRLQLQTTNKGKVAGWGLTSANGKPSPVLQVLEMPYVEVGTCISKSPPDFVAFITSDKICAGVQNNNSALCKGDSGGGLAFPATDRGVERHYLRGVVSTAPRNDDICNTDTYTSFTQIIKHVDFIKTFLTEL